MLSMLKRGLILIGLLALPTIAAATEVPDGPAYHKWIQEQAAQGNPPAGGSSHGAVTGNPAERPFFSDAGGAVQMDYHLQMDYSGLLARLKVLLTSPEWFGSHEEAQALAAMLEHTGAFNAGQYRESMTLDKDLLRYSIAQDYNGLDPNSFKGKFLAQPNLPFASANYVNANVLLYFGMQNVPQSALLLVREIASNPEAFESGPLGEILSEASGRNMSATDLAQVATLMDAMDIEGTVDNLLTGELAFAFYGIADMAAAVEGDIQPDDIDAALFLGVRDRNAIANMLGAYGADMGLASKGEAEGWQLFGFAGDATLTLALGPDVLLATTNWPASHSHMLQRMARLPVPSGQYHLHLNLDQLCSMVEPLAGLLEEELLDLDYLREEFDEYGLPGIEKLDAGLRYLLDLEAQGGCGAITLSGYYNNGYRSDFTMKPSVFVYSLYALGRWGGLAAAQSALEEMHETSSDEEDAYSEEDFAAENEVAAVDSGEIKVASRDLIVPGGDEELQ